MPSFKSINGIWEPAHERVATVDKNGQPQIYDGPDREAKKYIEEEGGNVGQDAMKDPQLLQTSRNMGFNSVEEYIAYFKPSEQQVAMKAEADAKVVTHHQPEAKEGVTGGTPGGFNDDTESPLEVMEQKKRGRPRRTV